MEIYIRKAILEDYETVVKGIDGILSKEGFGFINKLQVNTEIGRGSVFIAYVDGKEAGYRIGLDRLWNIAVHKDFRGIGVGRESLNHHRPKLVRVKNNPIGHLNKKQKEEFPDPTPFYEAMGFVCVGTDYGRNFWQKGKDTANFHRKGKEKHISIYIDPDVWLL